MPRSDAPEIVIRRLPLYLRCLTLLAERGQDVVASGELGAYVGVTPALVRKDLSYFGEFGKQGLGYKVAFLRDHLMSILQTDRDWPVILVGAGPLGHALMHYEPFQRWCYQIVAVFDRDPAKISQPIDDLTVQPMKNIPLVIEKRRIRVAILAVPARHAQNVAEDLVACGIRAILNYAPAHLVLPSHVRVAHIDPVISLQGMTHYL